LYTLSPTSFEVRQLPFIVDISVVADVVIGVAGAALVVVSVVADGVCANATLASSAEAAAPATVVFINISVLLSSKPFRNRTEKTRQTDKRSAGSRWNTRGGYGQKPPQ
jgi:hypothetical protein